MSKYKLTQEQRLQLKNCNKVGKLLLKKQFNNLNKYYDENK